MFLEHIEGAGELLERRDLVVHLHAQNAVRAPRDRGDRCGRIVVERGRTLLLQSALQNDPELPDVPNALTFAKTDQDRKVIELFLTQKKVARPLIAPPGVPPERLAMLRNAVAALAKDPEFLADAERSGLEADPISGAAVDQVVALIASTPPDVADRYAKAFAAPSQAP